MGFFKKEPNFKFMNKRFYAFGVSGVLIILGAVLFFNRGFNLGIDFTGGALVEVSFLEQKGEQDIRDALKDAGFNKMMVQRADARLNKFFIKTVESLTPMGKDQGSGAKTREQIEDEEMDNLEKISSLIDQALLTEQEKEFRQQNKLDVNNSSEFKISEFLRDNGIPEEDAKASARAIIQIKTTTNLDVGLVKTFADLEKAGLKKGVVSLLKEKAYLGGFTFLSTEVVGPQVGQDLRQKATLATVWALLGMLVYIGFRFRFIYGIAAVITLFHDVLICLSFIIFFRVEFSLSVMAALLTIVGYSLNDTIVIFDRVRDNVKLMRRDKAGAILDKSINQTLSRTLVTSGTTICVVLALFFLGGEVIHAFSFTLLIGVITGTYSSIFQSCAWLKIWEYNFLGRKKNK